jgi:hypothetical protein
MGQIAITNLDYNIPGIVLAAGGDGDVFKRSISNDILTVDDVSDAALQAALDGYDHGQFVDDRAWANVRGKRDDLLRDSDWTAVTDTALGEADQTDWEDYRQDLRDIPQTYSADVESVVWPDAPA